MRTANSRRRSEQPKSTETSLPSPSPSLRSRSQPNKDDSTSIMTSVGEKFKEIEEADTTGFLQYVDVQVHDTWDNAKAAMIGAQRLLHLHELPKEWQENEYVLSG